ncbi:DUF5675 family protein [Agarivorans gilvus]|uniref:DUF5675 family protein n=2 Tax=Agarivorans gilvus TaxID=680279 RepID=UPI000AE15EDE|nr:DUF5675 family protein [Agarivorans gilvus]
MKGSTIAKLQIAQSVGLGGVNTPKDIKAVQAALNQLLGLIPPTKKLAEDGKLGSKPENSKTVAAIKVFQKKVVGMVRPDGKIDVNGRSHRKFNEKLAVHTAKANLKIKVKRLKQGTKSTLGSLKIDGVAKSWYVLEPGGPDSQQEGSDHRISTGTYKLKPYSSPKYKNVYQLLNVPGRTNILIHAGNYHQDTLGCLMPGKTSGKSSNGEYHVGNSRTATKEIFEYIAAASDTSVEIINSEDLNND